MLAHIQQTKKRFEYFASDFLVTYHTSSKTLLNAMQYSFLNGGKRIRAALCYTIGDALNVDQNNLNYCALAIEAIHAYSLIHDDLPAMDNDNMRRGQPTCHIKFNEATAILAGDALQTLAFESLSLFRNITIDQLQALLKLLSTSAGAKGMVAGQQLDLDAEGQQSNLCTLEHIHQHKTGKMIEASVLMPVLLSSYATDTRVYNHLYQFATLIGLAFQIKDDLLDITQSTEILGKTANSDLNLDKSTYPSLLGIEKTQQILQQTIDQAHQHLRLLSEFNLERLWDIAQYILNRNH